MLAAPSTDPALGVDADLRPEGRDGPLVRSLASYARYYSRWSSPWEAQALLRARFGVGDAELGARFIELIDPVRYPAEGVSPDQLLEIRRIKGRVDSERLPRGADPATHTKLGRGGLADIEWTVQLLQLSHGAEVPSLRTQQTLVGIHAARDAGFLTPADADILEAAWRMVTRARNAIVLVRDKAIDQLPTSGSALVGVGNAHGLPGWLRPGSADRRLPAGDPAGPAGRGRELLRRIGLIRGSRSPPTTVLVETSATKGARSVADSGLQGIG